MKLRSVAMIAAAAVMAFGCAPKSPLIKTKVPPRPAGQEDMIGFAADPIADVGIGIVGIGSSIGSYFLGTFLQKDNKLDRFGERLNDFIMRK